MIVLQPTHKLGAMLQVLQQDEQLCNVQLYVSDATAAVHGCVLASQCSASIAGRVYHVLRDHTRPAELHLSHPDHKAPCKSDTLRRVIAFLYGQPLEIQDDALNEVLQLSLLLGLSDISERLAKAVAGVQQDVKGDQCEFETDVGQCKLYNEASNPSDFTMIGPSVSLDTELSSSIHTTFQRQNNVSLATDEEYACRDGSEVIFNTAAIDQLNSSWPVKVSEGFTILPTSNSLSKTSAIDFPDDKILDVEMKSRAMPSVYTIDKGLNISCQSGIGPLPYSGINTQDSFDVQTVLESAYNNEMTAEMCTLHETNLVTCGDEVDCLIELTIKEDAKDSCPDIIRTHNYITGTSYLCLQEGFANKSEFTNLTNPMNPSKNSSKKRPSKQRCLSPSTSKLRKHFLLPNISDDTNMKVVSEAQSPTQYRLLSRVPNGPDSFTAAAETSTHYASETNEAIGDEKVCGNEASSPVMSGAGLRCGVCHSYYRRCSDLVKHVLEQQHHSRTCPICAFQSNDAASQRRHFSLHDSPLPFLCGGCDLRFRTRAHLAMHVPKHSSKRPFSCTECGRTFKWRHAQQAHMLRHRAEGHLLCDVCGFSSSYISTFKAHLQQHTGQAFQCPHVGCSFKAFRKNNLKSHLVTHSNVRPHQCDVCGNSFSLARNLSRHMKLHLTARLLCSATSGAACAFTTTRPDKLRAHLHHKHGIRPDGATKFIVTEGHENAAAGDADELYFKSSSVEVVNSVICDRKCKVRRTDAVASVQLKNILVGPENPAGLSTTNASSSEIVHLVTTEEYTRVNVNTSIDHDGAASSSKMNTQKPNMKRKRKATLNPLKEPMKIVSDLDGGRKDDTKPSRLMFRKKKMEIPAVVKHSNSIPIYSRSKVVASRSRRKLSSAANSQRQAVSFKTKLCPSTKTRAASGSLWSACVPVSYVQQPTSDPLSRQSAISYVITSSFNADTTLLNPLSDSGKDLIDCAVSRKADTSFDASSLITPSFTTETLPVSDAENVHFTSYTTSLSKKPAQPMTLQQPNSPASFAVAQSPCSFSSDTSRREQLYAVSDSNSVTSILLSIAYENPNESRLANESEALEANAVTKTDLVSSHGLAFNNKIDSSQLHTPPGPISEQSQLHTPPGPSPDTPRASYSDDDHDARYRLFRAVPDDVADTTAGSGQLPCFNTPSNSFRLVVSDQTSCAERCFSPNRITPGNDSAPIDGLFAGVMQPEGSEELQYLHLQDCEVSLLPHPSKETISFLGPVLDCIEERNIEEVPKKLSVSPIPDGHAENPVRVLSSQRTSDVDLLNDARKRQHPASMEESQIENSGIERTMCPAQLCQSLSPPETVMERLEAGSVGESSSEAMKDGGVDPSLEVPADMSTVAGPVIDSLKTVTEDGRCLALDASSFDSLVQSLAALD